MSKSFIYNLILAIVAVIVFVFIGASVYDAFTRNPVNRAADNGGASSVSGQIESATPNATQPAQPTAAGDAHTQQQAQAAYDQTNDPASSSATQNSSGSASTGGDSASTGTAQQTAPATTSSESETGTRTIRNSNSQSDAPANAAGAANSSGATPSSDFSNSAKPAIRSNPDLRAVIPPVPTAPPRAEGTPPPNTSSQDMYNATDSGADDGSISDSFPAPVSNFPAPVTPGATGNAPGVNSDEQQRLQQLRNQKEQLRRDLGF